MNSQEAQLWALAQGEADRNGLCYVHPTGAEPLYALLTAERYRQLTGRIFPDDIPTDDPEWAHSHAEPEMLAEIVNAVRPYGPDENLDACWLFDIDGTLAHKNDRHPFDWDKVGEDTPFGTIIEVLQAMRNSGEIVLVSGREGTVTCRNQTEIWLHHHGVQYAELFMRAEGDYRKDSMVKHEIFWDEIAPRWNVRGVFDDRNQVVDMWRSMGLTCLQVAPGDF